MTAPTEARCPTCHDEVWTEIAPQDRTFTLHRCARCGCYRIHTEKAARAEIYRDYYTGTDAKRLSGIFDRIWGVRRRRRAAHLLRHAPPGARVCDVGCERGELLHILKEAGCAVVGTQLSRAAADFARDRFGVDVFVGELPDAPFEAGSFDVVLMINVLEHLPNPEVYLRCAAELLRKGGAFWVEVPNAGSFTARVCQKRWLHHDPKHHFWGFTATGLGSLLERHGFDVERVDHFSWEFGPVGCVQSWLNFLPGPRNVVFEIVRQGLSRDPRRLALHLTHALLAALLLLPAVVTAALEGLFRNGQVILLRVRRR